MSSIIQQDINEALLTILKLRITERSQFICDSKRTKCGSHVLSVQITQFLTKYNEYFFTDNCLFPVFKANNIDFQELGKLPAENKVYGEKQGTEHTQHVCSLVFVPFYYGRIIECPLSAWSAWDQSPVLDHRMFSLHTCLTL